MFRRAIERENIIWRTIKFLDMLGRRHKNHARIGSIDLEWLSFRLSES
jgi:hypothetical protein